MTNLTFRKGLIDGIPIALGYLSVSFSFGILCAKGGMRILGAILISLTNLTSAGQLAGVGIIFALGSLSEMALAQLVINLRYALMSVSLSQKADDTFNTLRRMIVSFGVTDEIYAVASSQKGLINPKYMYGLMLLPIVGWTSGTALGAIAGDILPADIVSALGIALYAMFIAIVLPPATEHKGVLVCALISAAISCILAYVPIFSFISGGFAIIICAIVAAVIAAILFPVKDEESEASEND
ncbi:MAG: AzlC family ABC transporter permease [Clostridia bacterium]|nr:AzlC family ABC transporter permease [Clostridia bacterium]